MCILFLSKFKSLSNNIQPSQPSPTQSGGGGYTGSQNASSHFNRVPHLSPPRRPHSSTSNDPTAGAIPHSSLGCKPALCPSLRKARQAHESGACEVGRRLRRTWATATCVCCCCCWRSCWRSCIWCWVDSGVPAPKPGAFEEEEGRSILGEAVSMGSWGRGETWRRRGDTA